MEDYDQKAFQKAAEPLMKYLAENHHPHTSAQITANSAEVLEGVMAHNTDQYLVD